MFDLGPQGNSICKMGSKDSVASESRAESFVALRIVDKTDLQLEVTKYNIDDYSAPRKKAGYICEIEGRISSYKL